MIAGCIMGREGIQIGVRVWRMIHGSRARGTVVSRHERWTRNGNRSLLYPVIEFAAASGETVTFTDKITARKWAIGRDCTVAYAPADPESTAIAIRPNSIVGLLIATTGSLGSFAIAFLLLSHGLPG